MRTICWVKCVVSGALLLAAAVASAQQRLVIAPHTSLRCLPHSEHCVLRVGARGHSLVLARDADVLKHDTATLKLVASLPSAVVLVDSYSSQPRGSECQAGTESFLRVVSFTGKVTYSVKLESCLENVALADSGVQWDAAGRRVQIHWVTTPTGQTAKDVVVTVMDDGSAR